MVVLIDQTHALIDKVTITCISITKITNPDLLIKSGIMEIHSGVSRYITLPDDLQISKIYIDKNSYRKFETDTEKLPDDNPKRHLQFDTFTAKLAPSGGAHISMELSVRGTDSEHSNASHNLNCWTVPTLWDQIQLARLSLIEAYGIDTSFSDARLRSIELNKTFPIASPFQYYRRALTYITSLPSAKKCFVEADYYERDQECRHPEDRARVVLTFLKTSGSRGMEVKIYDKTAQMFNEGFKTDKQYMRVELVLKSAQKIRNSLTSNSLQDLTDEKINTFFNDFVRIQLILQHLKRSEAIQPYLRRVLLEHYSNDKNTWANAVMTDIHAREDQNNLPPILSVDSMTSLVDPGNERFLRRMIRARESHNSADTRKHYKRISPNLIRQRRCRIKHSLQEACTNHFIYIQGDQERMEELFDNLLPDWRALIVTCCPPTT